MLDDDEQIRSDIEQLRAAIIIFQQIATTLGERIKSLEGRVTTLEGLLIRRGLATVEEKNLLNLQYAAEIDQVEARVEDEKKRRRDAGQ